MALIDLAQESRQAGLDGIRVASQNQQEVDQYNKNVRASNKSQRSAGLGAALGTGLAIGGPAGWAVGGTLAALSLI